MFEQIYILIYLNVYLKKMMIGTVCAILYFLPQTSLTFSVSIGYKACGPDGIPGKLLRECTLI